MTKVGKFFTIALLWAAAMGLFIWADDSQTKTIEAVKYVGSAAFVIAGIVAWIKIKATNNMD